MNFLLSMTMRARLLFGFSIIIIIMITLTVTGVRNVNYIDSVLTEITDINSVKQRYAINFRGSVHDRAIAIRDVGMARSSIEINQFEQEIRRLERFYNESESNMNDMLSSGVYFSTQEKQILSDIESIKARTLPLIEQIISGARNGNNVNAMVLDQARPAFIDYLNKINEFIDYQELQNQTSTPMARDAAGGFESLMLTFSSLAFAISIIVIFAIDKSIHLSLGGEPLEVQQRIKRFSEGHLSSDDDKSHTGSVLHSLTLMGKTIKNIAQSITNAAQNVTVEVKTVADGSSQILATADKLDQLTNQTAENLILIKDSTDEVANLAIRTKENSSQTVEFANEGKQVATSTVTEIENIAHVVNNTVHQIKELEERTKQIGGIISVISGISDQTNLLALNAAIEAARAGESGRGFAVVADEVRQLAKSTQDATTQIEEVILQVQKETAASVTAMETTQPQVENGKLQIEKTQRLLDNISDQAHSSLSLVNQVADSTSNQVEVIGDISNKMELISQISSESVEIIKNNESAARYLKDLSQELKSEISFFKVN